MLLRLLKGSLLDNRTEQIDETAARQRQLMHKKQQRRKREAAAKQRKGEDSSSDSNPEDGRSTSHQRQQSTAPQAPPPLAAHDAIMHTFRRLPFLSPNLERMFFFGIICCVDFLLTCMLIPFRLVLLLPIGRLQRADVLALFLLASGFLAFFVSGESRLYPTLYHWIRAQSMLKLYVIFNMLEVGERLLANFGNDCGDALYHLTRPMSSRDRKVTAAMPGAEQDRASSTAATVCLVGMMSACTQALHTMAVLLQVITVNVALNSENNGLFALLISNNFAEIKSAVWKKHTVESLFQMACTDMVERMSYVVYIVVMVCQHWESSGVGAVEPVELAMVLLFEMIVDFLKHYFICKYNNIPLSVYTVFLQVLLFDVAKEKCLVGTNLRLVSSDSNKDMHLQSTARYTQRSIGLLPNPLRRMGFAPFPYLSLMIWSASGPIGSLLRRSPSPLLLVGSLALCTLALKLFTSTFLTGWSMRFLCRTLLMKRKKGTKALDPARPHERQTIASAAGLVEANGKLVASLEPTATHPATSSGAHKKSEGSHSSHDTVPWTASPTPPASLNPSPLATSSTKHGRRAPEKLNLDPVQNPIRLPPPAPKENPQQQSESSLSATPTMTKTQKKKAKKRNSTVACSAVMSPAPRHPAFGNNSSLTGERDNAVSDDGLGLRQMTTNSASGGFGTSTRSASTFGGSMAHPMVACSFGISPPVDLNSPYKFQSRPAPLSKLHRQMGDNEQGSLRPPHDTLPSELGHVTLGSSTAKSESSDLEQIAKKSKKSSASAAPTGSKSKSISGTANREKSELLLLYDATLARLSTVNRFEVWVAEKK